MPRRHLHTHACADNQQNDIVALSVHASGRLEWVIRSTPASLRVPGLLSSRFNRGFVQIDGSDIWWEFLDSVTGLKDSSEDYTRC